MRRLILLAGALSALAAPLPAWAAPGGYDVSFPLCGRALPAGAAFGVVGVNGGLANNANPCLAGELAWAAATPGLPGQPPVSLYLNTADPGNRVADWPAPGSGGPTPYGGCDGSWTAACAHLYGQQRAAYGYQLAAGADAATVPWWLDVETLSTWAGPADQPSWATVNVAAVQGFVAGLRSSGARGPIGFYSTAFQWRAITGLDATANPDPFAAGSPDWVAGTGSASAARASCQRSFSGGPVRLAQYAAGGLDGDYACPPAAAARLRIVFHAVRAATLRIGGTIDPTYRGRVMVELTATYLGRVIHRRSSAAAASGRWQAILALPRRGRLRGGLVVARSRAVAGLLAGAARARVRLGG